MTKKSVKSTETAKSAAPARSAGAAFVSKETKATPKGARKASKPSLRYGDKDLALFRDNIDKAKLDALEELRMLRERLDDLTSSEAADESTIYSMHMAEQGSEAIEKEKTYAQIQRIQDYIRKLDDALLRIAEKTYGVCRMCGILIAKERLLAVPITTLSASYKIHQRCPDDGVDRIVGKTAEAVK